MSSATVLSLRHSAFSQPIWFCIFACAVSTVSFVFSERVQVNGGLGWDGVVYGRWAKDFHHEVFVKTVDTYYIQRILPAAIVHYGIRAVGAPLSDANIMRGFSLLSVALFSLMGWLWGLIARELALSVKGAWLGFMGLFINYMVLKHTPYVPVTTDSCAYAIGLGMLWSYLTGRTLTLAAITVASAFTWPLATFVGMGLLLFPRQTVDLEYASPQKLKFVAAGFIAVTAFALIRHAAIVGPQGERWLGNATYFQPLRPLVNLSAAISAIYLGLACAWLIPSPFYSKKFLTTQRFITAAVVAGAFGGIKQWQGAWSNGTHFMGVRDMFVNTALTTAAKPGVFLVTHAAYYGPFFLLAILLWKPVCALLHQSGFGLTLVVAAGVVLSLNSQSRYFINIFVMIIPFMCKAVDSLSWRWPQFGLIAAISLLASKCWLTTNVGQFTGKQLEFPDQLMFMTHGPWISNEMYLLQGAIALICSVAIYRVCIKQESMTLMTPSAARVAA